jgi:hypothetical protein
LPVGLQAELTRAYNMGKKVYVAYKTVIENYCIYDALTDGGRIEGIEGTADSIFTDLPSDSVKKGIDAVELNDILLQEGLTSTHEFQPRKLVKDRYSSNPCAEIALPNSQAECVLPVAKRVHATLVSNPDYVDERLLLMM